MPDTLTANSKVVYANCAHTLKPGIPINPKSQLLCRHDADVQHADGGIEGVCQQGEGPPAAGGVCCCHHFRVVDPPPPPPPGAPNG